VDQDQEPKFILGQQGSEPSKKTPVTMDGGCTNKRKDLIGVGNRSGNRTNRRGPCHQITRVHKPQKVMDRRVKKMNGLGVGWARFGPYVRCPSETRGEKGVGKLAARGRHGNRKEHQKVGLKTPIQKWALGEIFNGVARGEE